MARPSSLFLFLSLLSSLVLTSCGGAVDTDTDSSLEGMLNQDGTETSGEDDSDDAEEPYSVGPSEIPSDLVPNE